MASEYGWSDEYIGNLPLVRFRQITANVQMRRFYNEREENARFSWLARHITAYIAQTIMVEKGKPNTALDHAMLIGYDDIERAFLGAEPVPSESPKENKPGSFERLTQGFSQVEARARMS